MVRRRRRKFGSSGDTHADEVLKALSTAQVYIKHAAHKIAAKDCRNAADALATVFVLQGDAEANEQGAGRGGVWNKTVGSTKSLRADGERLLTAFKKTCVLGGKGRRSFAAGPKGYRTFIRSMQQFMDGRRGRTVDKGLTEDEARRACQRFNSNRTPAQVRKGIKMEYTSA
jgi:hypothetical protein